MHAYISPIDNMRWNRGIQILTTGTAATDVLSGAIDTLGYEFAIVEITTGTVGADTTTVRVDASSAAAGTYTAITGATTTVVNADDNIGKFGVIRLHGKPRYIKVVHNSATGGVTSNIAAHVWLVNVAYTNVDHPGTANSAAAGSESYSAAAFNVA